MRQASLAFHLAIAVVFSITAPTVCQALWYFVPFAAALKMAISIGVISYGTLLALSGCKRSGRLVGILTIAFLQLLLVMSSFSWTAFLWGSVAVLWIARVLLMGRGPLRALGDAVLVAFAFFLAQGVGGVTGSLAIAVWCFLFLLAVGTMLRLPTAVEAVTPEDVGAARFERAGRAAENALARMRVV